MLRTFEGVYKDGRVELLEKPDNSDGSKVIVTFLPESGAIDLRSRGISMEQAAEVRSKFGAMAEDWDRPEMDVYDAL